jgi:hypothetical protein
VSLVADKGLSKKPAFLAAYRVCASITKAAAALKIERTLHYRWLEEDPEYAKAFAAARREAGEALEDEAIRRAYAGFEEPVIYQGSLCYSPDQIDRKTGKPKRGAKPLTVRKYDSGLLMKLMDGFLPERYGRRKLELSGANGGAIKVEHEGLRRLSDEELSSLLAISRKLKPEHENETT